MYVNPQARKFPKIAILTSEQQFEVGAQNSVLIKKMHNIIDNHNMIAQMP